MDDEHPVNADINEASALDPEEWDVVQSIHGFNKLSKLVKHARRMTPRIIDTQTNSHPLDVALEIIFDCKQAALLAYGKVMWSDAHEMRKDITNEEDS